MTDTVVEALILDLLDWLAARERTYEEVMDAWRTSCPNSRCGKKRMTGDLS
jgi:D-3-phosphoglycerate dehydrogenase